MSTAPSEQKPVRHPEKQKRPDRPSGRKPSWIRVKAPTSKGYQETRDLARGLNLHTVCEEAACPNIGECWQKKHARILHDHGRYLHAGLFVL